MTSAQKEWFVTVYDKNEKELVFAAKSEEHFYVLDVYNKYNIFVAAVDSMA